MENETNKKSNVLVIVLGIVILILCAVIFYLAFNLGREVANKENNAIVDNNNTDSDNNKTEDDKNQTNNSTTQELSLEDAEVKKIIDKFWLTTEKHSANWQFELYVTEALSDFETMRIAYYNVENSVKTEENCNREAYSGDGYGYTCTYIKYDDFNKSYKSLSGKDLSKTNLDFELYYLIYDSASNMYRICNVYAGGATSQAIVSKINKAEKVGDYIYLYERVGYVSDDNPKGVYELAKPHLYNIEGKYTGDFVELGTYEYDQYNPYNHLNKIIEEHIDKFDTYKWTFKKDSNGEYIYQSLEYIEK